MKPNELKTFKRFDEALLGELKRGDVFYFRDKFKGKKPKFVVEIKQLSLLDPDIVDSVVVVTKDESKETSETKTFKPELAVIYLRSLN